MALFFKQPSSKQGNVFLLNCCDYSHLIKTQVSQADEQTKRILWLSLSLLGIYFLAELSVGFWSSSLSLQADAGHVFSDTFALGITLVAIRITQRPAQNQATFGHNRVEVLAALANGIAICGIAVFLVWEALQRFQSPEPVFSLPVLFVAAIGLVVNIININLLYKVSVKNLNLRSASLHLVADTASSVGLIITALTIYCWNWIWMDAVVSALIAGFISFSAMPIIRESWEILMEYAPNSIDLHKVKAAITSLDDVDCVNKLHIWTIGANQVALIAHLSVNLSSADERDYLLKELQIYLEKEFGIKESTLQLTSCRSMATVNLHPLLNSNLIDLLAQKHSV